MQSATPQPAPPSFDVDVDFAWLRFGALRNGDGQHAVLQLGVRLVGVGAFRQRERAREAAIATLAGVKGLALLCFFRLAFPRDAQPIVLYLTVRQIGSTRMLIEGE